MEQYWIETNNGMRYYEFAENFEELYQKVQEAMELYWFDKAYIWDSEDKTIYYGYIM